MRRRPLFGPTLLAVVLVACPVAAQSGDADELARRHYALGEELYQRGELLEAAQAFEESYRLSGREELLYNVFLAYRDAGELVRAAAALRAYLEAVPEAPNAALLRARLEALEAELAEAASAPAPVTSEAEPAVTTTTTTPSPVGAIVAGVGGAALVAGIVTGALAMDRASTLSTLCGPERLCPPGHEPILSEAQSLALATDVLLIVGGLTAATGLVLALVMPGDTSEVRLAIGPGSLSIEGGF